MTARTPGNLARAAAIAGMASVTAATFTSRANAGSLLPLRTPACGVSAWGVTGDHGSAGAERPGEVHVAEPPPAEERGPALGPGLFIFGATAAATGTAWSVAIAADDDRDATLAPLAIAIPMIALGVTLAAIGVARWDERGVAF
jgi:hypothetical protein